MWEVPVILKELRQMVPGHGEAETCVNNEQERRTFVYKTAELAVQLTSADIQTAQLWTEKMENFTRSGAKLVKVGSQNRQHKKH